MNECFDTPQDKARRQAILAALANYCQCIDNPNTEFRQCAMCAAAGLIRDSDGTATAAASEDMPEQWRTVPGYEGYYEVSNLGFVRSLARVVPSTAHGLRRTIHPRFLKQRLDKDGYPIVTLTKNSVAKLVPIHRLVAQAFHGPCPEGQECAHLDGNRENPRADNLTWATKAENEAHKYLHGTRQARSSPKTSSGESGHDPLD